MAQLRQYRSGGCLQWALQRRRQLTRLRRGRDDRIKASPLWITVSSFVLLSKSQRAFRGVYQSPWRCDDMHKIKVVWNFGEFPPVRCFIFNWLKSVLIRQSLSS